MHLSALLDEVFAGDRHIVFGLAGDDAGIAADAGIEVDRHKCWFDGAPTVIYPRFLFSVRGLMSGGGSIPAAKAPKKSSSNSNTPSPSNELPVEEGPTRHPGFAGVVPIRRRRLPESPLSITRLFPVPEGQNIHRIVSWFVAIQGHITGIAKAIRSSRSTGASGNGRPMSGAVGARSFRNCRHRIKPFLASICSRANFRGRGGFRS